MYLRPETSIASLGFSNRTVNALKRAGITAYSHLQTLLDSDFDFHEVRGLGETCIAEILRLKQSDRPEIYEESRQFQSFDEYTFSDYIKSFETGQRNWQILVDFCNGGRKATLEKIGEKYEITRERTRQIIAKTSEKLKNAVRDGVIRRGIVRMIDEAADKRTEVSLLPVKDEMFTRPGLAYLMSHILPQRYTIIRNPKLNGEWFVKTSDNVEDMLDLLIDRIKNSGEQLPVDTVVRLFSIPEDMLMSIDGIVEKDGYVAIGYRGEEPRKDRCTLVTEYLESIYRPASVTELAEKTGLTEAQVRGALQDKYRYVNVGKSVYDLAERNYEGLSANALATNILTAEDRPLKIDQIIDYIHRYNSISVSSISLNLTYSDTIERNGEYYRLKNWGENDGKKIKAYNSYLITLDEAVFDVVSSSDKNTLLDSSTIKELLEESYKDAVSTNETTIRATLSRLANDNLISRVGVNTGCYARSRELSEAEIEKRIAAIAAKYELGLFLKDRKDKMIEIRYKTERVNSDKRWRQIDVAGQNGRYIFAKNAYRPDTVIKYLKERVVEYRDPSSSEPKRTKIEVKKPVTTPTPQSKGWYDDVKGCVARLGNTFTLNQVYGFEKELSATHPENDNVQTKIRQQLQNLRDNYVIEFLQPGVYRKLGAYRNEPSDSGLVINNTYRNDDITRIFKVSSQGGMRKSNTTNSLVLIARHRSDNPYDDKWDGDILNYTGMGLRGAQSINYMQNKTLAESKTNGITVYLFESYADNEYVYRGIVELVGKPFYVPEEDEDGAVRTVLKFPIRVKEGQ